MLFSCGRGGVAGMVGRAYVARSAGIAGGIVMHAVVRMYSGAGGKKLIDLLEERKKEVEELIRPVKGFVSYSLIRTADGGASVTVCEDKAGTDESLRVAREWIAKNASNTGASPPTVLEGSVILQLK
jgi:proline dehydrogenase